MKFKKKWKSNQAPVGKCILEMIRKTEETKLVRKIAGKTKGGGEHILRWCWALRGRGR